MNPKIVIARTRTGRHPHIPNFPGASRTACGRQILVIAAYREPEPSDVCRLCLKPFAGLKHTRRVLAPMDVLL